MSYAIRSKGDAPFRRDGVSFPHDSYLVVDEPTERQLSEPMLEAIEYDGEATIRGLPVAGAETGSEDEDGAGAATAGLTDEELEDLVQHRGFILMVQDDFDELRDQVATLITERGELVTANGTLTSDRDAAKTDLGTANARIATVEGELATANGTIETLRSSVAAIDQARTEVESTTSGSQPVSDEAIALKNAILSASATAIDRLPDDALRIIASLHGVDPIPATKAEILAALKPAS